MNKLPGVTFEFLYSDSVPGNLDLQSDLELAITAISNYNKYQAMQKPAGPQYVAFNVDIEIGDDADAMVHLLGAYEAVRPLVTEAKVEFVIYTNKGNNAYTLARGVTLPKGTQFSAGTSFQQALLTFADRAIYAVYTNNPDNVSLPRYISDYITEAKKANPNKVIPFTFAVETSCLPKGSGASCSEISNCGKGYQNIAAIFLAVETILRQQKNTEYLSKDAPWAIDDWNAISDESWLAKNHCG